MGSSELETGLMTPVWINRGNRLQLVQFGKQASVRRFGSKAIAELVRTEQREDPGAEAGSPPQAEEMPFPPEDNQI